MSKKTTDVFISGAGIAGLALAIGLAKTGRSVTLADPAPPPQSRDEDQSDLRSTAFLRPGRDFLDDIGVWTRLRDQATPLEVLRVINCTGQPPQIGTERAFRSDDLGEAAFGWNLPNWLTRKTLAELAQETPGLDLRFGAGFERILTRDREARITLTDGLSLTTRLAIAADGRNSPLREAVGIETEITRYGQKALAFAVTHDVPHGNISTELYSQGGAFVLVPLPDQSGKPASAVVWMHDGPEAVRLAKLDDTAFSNAVTDRSAGVLGPLQVITQRNLWPVVTQRAKHLTAIRVALLAEAAHVFPPIGAQGLNTSLTDVRALLDLATRHTADLGGGAMLTAFAKARERDIRARSRVIDLYNRLCRNDAAPASQLRDLGLSLVHDVPQLRTSVMRAGMGV